jgi:hypothetical protein
MEVGGAHKMLCLVLLEGMKTGEKNVADQNVFVGRQKVTRFTFLSFFLSLKSDCT